MSDLIQSDNPFTPAEREVLARLAGLIIPASDEFGVPGANDPEIMAPILARLAPAHKTVRDGLEALEELAQAGDSEHFVEVEDDEEALKLVHEITPYHTMFVRTLVAVITQCYYEDPRVLASLDMEARPPFPGGYEVEQGDWSLLDPVKQREAFFRKI